ncbi:MAG: hypothetical protein FWH56_12380, partial [Betaproteobacteria bacterium]|nr:hypothetical protein [Betaproteobacteria bacterium]
PSTLPHRQGATAKSAPAIPPKAQTGPREQPHITPASRTTTAAPEPLPQTGSATRLPPTQSRFQTAWPHSARSNLPDTFSIEPLEPSEPPPQPQTATPAPAAPPPPAEAPAPAPVEQVRAITEELKLLDTLIVGEVEAWLREELPALVVREISRLNERLRAEAIAHLRATLLPRISEHISGQIDRIRNPEQGAS